MKKTKIKRFEDGYLSRFYTTEYILSLKGKKRKLAVIDNWVNMLDTRKDAKDNEEDFCTKEEFDFDANNYYSSLLMGYGEDYLKPFELMWVENPDHIEQDEIDTRLEYLYGY